MLAPTLKSLPKGSRSVAALVEARAAYRARETATRLLRREVDLIVRGLAGRGSLIEVKPTPKSLALGGWLVAWFDADDLGAPPVAEYYSPSPWRSAATVVARDRFVEDFGFRPLRSDGLRALYEPLDREAGAAYSRWVARNAEAASER